MTDLVWSRSLLMTVWERIKAPFMSLRARLFAVLVFAVGGLFLWGSTIASLIATGGFAGIITWQIVGAPYPAWRTWLLYRRLCRRDERGLYVVEGAHRRLLWGMFWVAFGNVAANGVVVALIVRNWRIGRLSWSTQDTWVVRIGGAILLIVLILWVLKRRGIIRLSSRQLSFGIIGGSRADPTCTMAWSPNLGSMSVIGFIGLSFIALQTLYFASIELVSARETYRKTAGATADDLSDARWGFRGEVVNFASSLFPLAARLF